MSDTLSPEVEALLLQLKDHGVHGVVSLASKGHGRLDLWWGDRSKCLGLTARLTYAINTEMDEFEDSEDTVEDDLSEDDQLSDLAKDFPQYGTYL